MNRRDPYARRYAVNRLLDEELNAPDPMSDPSADGAMPMSPDQGYPYGRRYAVNRLLDGEVSSDPGADPVSGTMPVGDPMRDQVNPNGLDARQALGGYAGVGTMLGFNTAMDYADAKAANSVKNTFGRIASRYAAKPSSLDQILADPDFKRYFPHAKKAGFDKIDFGGVLSDFESGEPVGVKDVGGAFDPNSDTGAGWTWQDLSQGVGSGSGPSGGAPSSSGPAGLPTPPTETPAVDPVTGQPIDPAAYRRIIGNDPMARRRSMVRDLLGPGPERYGERMV